MPTPDEARRALALVSTAAEADARKLVTATQSIDELLVAVPDLVAYYSDGTAALAADHYDDLREAARAPGRYIAEPVVNLREEKLRRAVLWASEPLIIADDDDIRDVALAESRLAEVVQYESARPFRDTILSNQQRDPFAVGWRRHTSFDGCRFCRMLAERGAVYKQATARFASHPHCSCTAAPVFDGEAGEEADVMQYVASERKRTDAERRKLREYLDQKYPDMPKRSPTPLMPGSKPLPFAARVPKVAGARSQLGAEFGVAPEMVKAFERDVAALRRKLYQEAAQAQRQSANWLDRADAFKLRRPPRKGAGAEYDWLEQISAKERQRLSRWWSDSPTANIDVVFERAKVSGLVPDTASIDDFVDEWLYHSRVVDAGGALRRGRIPDANRYGGLNPDDLLPTIREEGIDLTRIIGGASNQESAAYLAQRELSRHADEAWNALGPAAQAVEGPAPFQMSFLAWEDEVRNLEEMMRDTPDLVTAGLRRRYSELVPPRIDDGQDFEQLYAEIVEVSRVAQVEVAEHAVIPW